MVHCTKKQKTLSLPLPLLLFVPFGLPIHTTVCHSDLSIFPTISLYLRDNTSLSMSIFHCASIVLFTSIYLHLPLYDFFSFFTFLSIYLLYTFLPTSRNINLNLPPYISFSSLCSFLSKFLSFFLYLSAQAR